VDSRDGLRSSPHTPPSSPLLPPSSFLLQRKERLGRKGVVLHVSQHSAISIHARKKSDGSATHTITHASRQKTNIRSMVGGEIASGRSGEGGAMGRVLLVVVTMTTKAGSGVEGRGEGRGGEA